MQNCFRSVCSICLSVILGPTRYEDIVTSGEPLLLDLDLCSEPVAFKGRDLFRAPRHINCESEPRYGQSHPVFHPYYTPFTSRGTDDSFLPGLYGILRYLGFLCLGFFKCEQPRKLYLFPQSQTMLS